MIVSDKPDEMARIVKADDHDFLIGYVLLQRSKQAQRQIDLATARMLAAAPELLAACKSALFALEMSDPEEEHPIVQESLALILRAIAKAEAVS